ncbi:MAG: NAD-dependent epimerase/dehydratase family protein [Paludibacter sp.]|nr:NAD-dependent epimerase/dehydratase family protein [Paludibacter sp.]
MTNKKAIVIGSTGLVGRELIKQLSESPKYSEIISLVRRPSGFNFPKIKEHIINFDEPETWRNLVIGDVLFSCMGTTIANAKTKANQYKVDFKYQYKTAQIAATNQVPAYVLISAAGANAKSVNFYSRMKGELDEAVSKLNFQTINILRPTQLYGNRTEKRTMERLALKIMFFINKAGILKKIRPVHAGEVANAMIKSVDFQGLNIINLKDIFSLIK